ATRDLELLDWPTTGARLKRLTVGPPEGFSDPQNTLRSAYGLTGDTLLLIRPDGYIGHIATRDFLTTTQAAVRAMTPGARSRTMSQPSHTSPGSGATG
ncbi:FAD-binding monooxygenase, partial [Streptomyces sp. NPDC001351]